MPDGGKKARRRGWHFALIRGYPLSVSPPPEMILSGVISLGGGSSSKTPGSGLMRVSGAKKGKSFLWPCFWREEVGCQEKFSAAAFKAEKQSRKLGDDADKGYTVYTHTPMIRDARTGNFFPKFSTFYLFSSISRPGGLPKGFPRKTKKMTSDNDNFISPPAHLPLCLQIAAIARGKQGTHKQTPSPIYPDGTPLC